MACNYDEGCYKIAQDYGNYSSSISADAASITNSIGEITGLINKYDIPDDYLGSKIQEEISKIAEFLSSDNDKVMDFVDDIQSFTSDRASEHLEHYYDWIERQLALEEQRKKTEQVEK